MSKFGARDEVDEALGGLVRRLFVRMHEEDSEFIATDSRDDIALAHSPDEQSCDLDKRGVSSKVPAGVVDELQPVEIDEQQRRLLIVAVHSVDEPIERADEAAPIRQLHEAVLVSQHVELLDAFLQLRNPAAQSADLRNKLLDVRDVRYLIRHCPRASALVCGGCH